MIVMTLCYYSSCDMAYIIIIEKSFLILTYNLAAELKNSNA